MATKPKTLKSLVGKLVKLTDKYNDDSYVRKCVGVDSGFLALEKDKRVHWINLEYIIAMTGEVASDQQ